VVFVVVHDALFASGQLAKGETVLVTAAPSGVGVTTLILAKYLGARVIGTSRSAEKLEKLKSHGLDVGVVTGSEGFGAAVAPLIDKNGVDMVVDNIGGDVLAPCLEALAVGGRYVSIGRMSGVLKGELDVDRLAERRLHLYGVSNRLRNAAQRAQSMRCFVADLMPALGDGRIRPVIDRCFALDDIAAAQAHVEADRDVAGIVRGDGGQRRLVGEVVGDRPVGAVRREPRGSLEVRQDVAGRDEAARTGRYVDHDGVDAGVARGAAAHVRVTGRVGVDVHEPLRLGDVRGTGPGVGGGCHE
jgi:NADPH:quinone reductase-like Zn-dependent oxidoreductase